MKNTRIGLLLVCDTFSYHQCETWKQLDGKVEYMQYAYTMLQVFLCNISHLKQQIYSLCDIRLALGAPQFLQTASRLLLKTSQISHCQVSVVEWRSEPVS